MVIIATQIHFVIIAIQMTNQNILFSIVLICFNIASIFLFIAISIVICFVVGIVKKILLILSNIVIIFVICITNCSLLLPPRQ